MADKYRKRPVVIEAVQFKGDISCLDAFPFNEVSKIKYSVDGNLVIPTLEGDMTASPGDYIIRGTHGEYYPCKPDIFEANYEQVEE